MVTAASLYDFNNDKRQALPAEGKLTIVLS